MNQDDLFEPPAAKTPWATRWQRGWRGQSLTVIALLLGGIGAGLVLGSLVRPKAPPTTVALMPPAFPEAAEPDAPDTGALGPDAVSPAQPIPDTPSAIPSEEAETVAALPPPTKPIALPAPFSGTQPPWRRYAVAAPASEGRAKVVIVIDDMGVDRGRSAQTVALPGPLTLSYLPYGQNLPVQTAEARHRGHELMVHMPMQPSLPMDPGPDALTVALSPEEVQRRVRSNLGKFEGYVGINNHMGSRFTTWEAGMTPVIAELRARGLLWLDSRTSPKSVGTALAQKMAVPNIDRDVFLDDDPSLENVRKQLRQLEAVALRTGKGVAIGHPKDNTIAALKEWLPTLPGKGLVLVPITAVVKAPAAHSVSLP
ncbi:MAG: divergent polysaccharide deacetylase family protein [Elstera sp.]